MVKKKLKPILDLKACAEMKWVNRISGDYAVHKLTTQMIHFQNIKMYFRARAAVKEKHTTG